MRNEHVVLALTVYIHKSDLCHGITETKAQYHAFVITVLDIKDILCLNVSVLYIILCEMNEKEHMLKEPCRYTGLKNEKKNQYK